MQINNNNSYYYKIPTLKYSNRKNIPTFNGHTGCEEFAKNSIGRLVHETAFFREAETDEFLKNFILTQWKNKPKINIICGACSTGEEVITLSMLLNEIKNKVSILGLDISPNSIKEAKSKVYEMSYNPLRNTSADKDRFLWLPNAKKRLSNKEKEYKILFEQFFDKIEIKEMTLFCTKTNTNSLFLKFIDKLAEFLIGKNSRKKYEGIFKLKNEMAQNCSFQQADIMDIDLITSEKKADIITFRNALYHLITKETLIERYLTLESDAILDKILNKIKTSLNEDGLVVFGKEENKQILSNYIIPKGLMKNGFKPLNGSDEVATVWQKK